MNTELIVEEMHDIADHLRRIAERGEKHVQCGTVRSLSTAALNHIWRLEMLANDIEIRKRHDFERLVSVI